MRIVRLLRRAAAPIADRRAATAIEYGLIAALIAVAAIGAMRGLGGGVSSMWGNVSTEVDRATK